MISKIIRQSIGFDGFLISDDLDMKALHGPLAERARDALAAGCDAVLQCNGVLEDMEKTIVGVRALSPDARRRLHAAARARPELIPFEPTATDNHLTELLRASPSP